MKNDKPLNIDQYIESFPEDVQKVLQEIRALIKSIAPEAQESISYGMPTFNTHQTYLVYFAGFKNHIGFYPAPVGVKEFEEDLAGYKTGKGSVQFPLNKPMPVKLITKIVKYRLAENKTKSEK